MMLEITNFIKKFVKAIRKELILSSGNMINVWSLVSLKNQPVYYKNRRLSVIKARIIIMAAMFSILALLWSAVDFLAFPPKVFNELFVARWIASLLFLLIAIAAIKFEKTSGLLICIELIIIILIGFYFFFTPSDKLDYSFYGQLVLTSYSLMPLVLVAAIGLFPLTIIELLWIILPILAIFFAATINLVLVQLSGFDLGSLWIMIVLSIIASLTSLSQLKLLMEQVSLAAHDLVTGCCLNRIYGEETLDLTWSLSKRYERNYSIAFLDLDHFKDVNDNFGHAEGDKVLSIAAKNIKRNIRASDFIIRWGGDEFLIAMPDTDIEGAKICIDRLVTEGFGKIPDGKIQTASIGVAEYKTSNADTIKDLIEKADKAVYQAKSSGRNQYKVY